MENGINKQTSFLSADQENLKLNQVRKTVFKYVYHWYLFVLSLLISGTIAYYYLEYSETQYQTAASILLSKDEKAQSGNKDVIDAVLYGQPKINVQDEIETMKSRYLLSRVVIKNQLTASVYKKGRIKTTEIFNPAPFFVEGDFGPDSLGNASFEIEYLGKGTFKLASTKTIHSFGQRFKINNRAYTLSANPLGSIDGNTVYVINLMSVTNAANNISGSLKINAKSTYSNVIQLAITSNSPNKGEFLLTKIMQEYIQLGVDEKRRIHENTRNFITERLRVLSGELGTVEGNLENYKRSNKIINPETQSQAIINGSSVNQQVLSQLVIKKKLIGYLSEYLQDGKNQYNIVPTNMGLEDPILLTLANQYNNLVLQREKELQVLTPVNPIIKELESSIQKNRLALIENLKNVSRANEVAIQHESGTENSNSKMFDDVPRQERQLGSIMREEKIKNDLFSYLLQKREETEIALAGVIPQVKILDQALANPSPIFPSRKTTWALALLLGIAVPLMIIWIKDLLNNRVNSKEDILSVLQMPLLGEIGHGNELQPIVVRQYSREVIGEQFRNLRSNIGFLTSNKDQLVILTTSSNSGDGKSFLSLNLAATYSVSGKRTILVELDLRKPKLAKSLSIKTKSGVSDYLASQRDYEEMVVGIEGYDNLSILFAGSIPPNPAELLLTKRMHQLIEELKNSYDVIVLDCPPIGLVADAQIVSNYADLSIYVIRQRVTYKSQLAFLNELYESKRLTNMSVVVNDVVTSGYYGYYGYGGYYGSYNYGAYGDTQKKKRKFKFKKAKASV